jgi:glycosyltransferase involved in cell wall biosynthesis
MSRAPRVSVVLATRNQARWLPETLASVTAQTMPDWELLLVDDGSTDETAAIARDASHDPRVRYLPGPQAERAAARNRGLAEANADLVAFLDGDDLWHPEKLAHQAALLDTDPAAGLCYTVARYVDPRGRPLPIRRPPAPIAGELFGPLVRANRMILSSVMVRRAVLEDGNAFDASLPVMGCEDWDLWLRIARRHHVLVVPAELTRYRVHPGNTAQAAILASGLAVLEKLYRDPTTATAAKLSAAAARARLVWYHAGAATAESRRTALRLAARAFAASPASLASRPALGALARLASPRAAHRLLG